MKKHGAGEFEGRLVSRPYMQESLRAGWSASLTCGQPALLNARWAYNFMG